jgi:hypothetical protein
VLPNSWASSTDLLMVLLVSAGITLFATRSSLVASFEDFIRIPGAFNCPMCTGFWATIMAQVAIISRDYGLLHFVLVGFVGLFTSHVAVLLTDVLVKYLSEE